MEKNQKTKAALIIGIAILFVAAPLLSMMYFGVFSWHIQQPAAIDGGLELLALILCLGASLRFLAERVRWIAVGFFLWVYARHYGVDLTIILDYLYVDSLFALGWLLLPLVGQERNPQPAALLTSGVLGVIAWSLCMWIMSLGGFGAGTELRWLAICVLGLSLALSKGPRLAGHIVNQIGAYGRRGIVFHALIIAVFAMLFAKSSVSTDYDSMWYGLVGDRTLIGSGNLFENEGLVALVHYYPKLYETLLIPISGIGGVTVIAGLGIFSWVLVLVTAHLILQELGIHKRWRPAFLALIATLPALANISMTAKGDAFSAWLICAAIYATLRFKSDHSPHWFWLAISAEVLAPLARLSAIPYAGMLFAITASILVAAMRRPSQQNFWWKIARSRSVLIFFSCLTLAYLVIHRTLVLAGVPIIAPDSLVLLAADFGFHLNYPIGQLPNSGWPHLAPHVAAFSYLFNPNHYSHLALYWTGNYWLFIPLMAFAYGARAKYTIIKGWPLAIIGGLFFVILLGHRFDPTAGADGNYFIIPLICLTLFSAITVQDSSLKSLARFRLVSALLLAFSVSAMAICLVTGSWGPGTRGFDVLFSRNPLDYDARRRDQLQSSHLAGVASFFRAARPSSRVIGAALAPDAWWLPVRYEPIDIISWSRPEIVASPDNLALFLRKSSIEFVILRNPNSYEGAAPPYSEALLIDSITRMHQTNSAVKVYFDGYYEVWKLDSDNLSTLEDGSYLHLSALETQTCATVAPFAVRASWLIKKTEQDSINIFVSSPFDPEEHLWSRSSRTGSQVTGLWVLPGSKFSVRNVTNNKLLLLGKVMPECTFGDLLINH